MELNSREVEVVRLIATGSTMASAARAMNISASRLSQLLATACRKLKLPYGVDVIHANPQPYLARLPQQPVPYSAGLRMALERELVQLFQLPSGSAVTPELLSNYSASQLLAHGLTPVAVGQISSWLRAHDRQFKRGRVTSADLRVLGSAIDLLEAFHFDVTAAREQLQGEQADAG